MTTIRPEITGRASGDKPKQPMRGFSAARAPPVTDEEDIAAKVKTKPKPRTPTGPDAELKAQYDEIQQQQKHDQEARRGADARARKAEEARRLAEQQAQTTCLEPLAVSPRQTGQLLNIGQTRVWQLIKGGELETYKEGRSTKVTMRSIRVVNPRILESE